MKDVLIVEKEETEGGHFDRIRVLHFDYNVFNPETSATFGCLNEFQGLFTERISLTSAIMYIMILIIVTA